MNMRDRKLATWPALLLGIVGVAGCGDDDSTPDARDADVGEDAAVPEDGEAEAEPDSLPEAETDAEAEAEAEPDVADVPADDGAAATTTLEGVVWTYYYTELVTPPLGQDWGSGATVSTVGLPTEVTATAGSAGQFALEGLPVGREIMLRATGLADHHDGLSRLFAVEEGEVEFLVLPTRDLVTRVAAPEVWNVTVDPAKGFVAGLICTWDPTADPPVTGFIGDATVSISPTVTGADYELIYFDSSNVANTSRTGTDPAQSLFFAVNLPPRGAADPYELTVHATGHTFPTIRFAVEADTMTYLLIKAD